jgi:16S rRNA processing protein RimM
MALVGRVARAHGLRGQLVVNVDTDFPSDRFRRGAELFVRRKDGIQPVTIASVRFHRERPIIGLAGIDSVERAAELVGAELRVPVERLMPLPAGSFYRHDLVGCHVETAQGTRVGVVVDVEGAREHSKLIVETPRGVVLIPLAAGMCHIIDPAAKRIVVDPPEGLLGLNLEP